MALNPHKALTIMKHKDKTKRFEFQHDGQSVYWVSANAKDHTLSLHSDKSDKEPRTGVIIDDDRNFQIFAGALRAGDSVARSIGEDGRALTRSCTFVVGGRTLSWRRMEDKEVTLSNGEITNGLDWKLVTAVDMQGCDALALYVHSQKKFDKVRGRIYLLRDLSDQVEVISLTAIVGILEREALANTLKSENWLIGLWNGAGPGLASW